jgi:hypothetical protein
VADEVTLPTQEEIAALPRWAKVAFAARCTRRVLPVFKHNWPAAPKKHLDAVKKAVEVAERAASAAYASAAGASAAARAAAYAAGSRAIPTIRHDFQRILDESRNGNWTDDTPVPPWVFGPMWPNGVPEGWPEADPQEQLQVTVGVPEDAEPKQTTDYLNRLHALLNRLNIHNSGPGITVDTVRREQPKDAPVPVGGGS